MQEEENLDDESLAIAASGLALSYGSVQALRGVDLAVRRGDIMGFLGPNGAGKTTTIRCLLDLIRPQSGTMRVLGLDPVTDSISVRSRTGYLPGELTLEGSETVSGVLRYFNGLRSRKSDWTYVRTLADRLHLDLSKPVKNLSKGNKQKVGLIQALMSRPELLLLDEPTSGLDPLMQQEVYCLLRESNAEGTTIFFSSHVISEVEAVADRVAIIRDGVIAEEANPKHLFGMSLRRLHIRFKEPVSFTKLLDIPGVSLSGEPAGDEAVLQVEGEMDALIKALGAYPVLDIKTEQPYRNLRVSSSLHQLLCP